eukprot:NODE_20213_length_807_cov_45.711765.p3 GENE.NODE_20213_length_807_cov_45.711765~~NODE_20213_length_807_cov_45.711765.p3  ORF type:complete len:141 (+),score=14.69 NODE_20213_length_807_cov_45.711765:269-691(+)
MLQGGAFRRWRHRRMTTGHASLCDGCGPLGTAMADLCHICGADLSETAASRPVEIPARRLLSTTARRLPSRRHSPGATALSLSVWGPGSHVVWPVAPGFWLPPPRPPSAARRRVSALAAPAHDGMIGRPRFSLRRLTCAA